MDFHSGSTNTTNLDKLKNFVVNSSEHFNTLLVDPTYGKDYTMPLPLISQAPKPPTFVYGNYKQLGTSY